MAKRQSAFFTAVKEAQTPEAPTDTHKVALPTTAPGQGMPHIKQEPKAQPPPPPVEKKAPPRRDKGAQEKISFYLTPGQQEKLYDLADQYRRKTGIKISQQAIVRRLIDVLSLEMIFPKTP